MIRPCSSIQAATTLDLDGPQVAKDPMLLQTLTTPLLIPPRFAPRPSVSTRAVPRHRSISFLGGSVGLLAFLLVGLFPALVLGGAAGARAASVILGVQAPHGLGATAFVVLGLALTAAVGAAFFTVLGAVAGSIVGVLTRDQALRPGTP